MAKGGGDKTSAADVTRDNMSASKCIGSPTAAAAAAAATIAATAIATTSIGYRRLAFLLCADAHVEHSHLPFGGSVRPTHA